MKLHGRVYVEVPLQSVQEGDYVLLPGRRVRRVSAVRRKAERVVSISLEPQVVGGVTLHGAKRVEPANVESAWRWHKDVTNGSDNENESI